MRVEATATHKVRDGFRVQQVYSIFGVQVAEHMGFSIAADLPDLTDNWKRGVIVGPSGAGKSRLAREAGGENYYIPTDWPDHESFLEGFPDTIQKDELFGTLEAVGLSSAPHYLLPYAALSTGQKFRADLARSLLIPGDCVWFDEYTSVVDRTVAKISSAAIAKQSNRGTIKKKFVAVTCHYDIIEWLEPDWVYDVSTGTLTRGSLRRPPIELEFYKCAYDAWELFGPHHYLDGSLHRGSQCYKATWNGVDVAFCAVMHAMGFENMYRITRLVTLPDYQGVGIGSKLCDWVASEYHRQGKIIRIGTSHPAMRRHLDKSPKWTMETFDLLGRPQQQKAAKQGNKRAGSAGRPLFRFKYIG